MRAVVVQIAAAIVMLLGLSGLVDNVVVWYGFLQDIVGHYHTFRDIVFSWLPFALGDQVKDHLVVGASVAAAAANTYRQVDLNETHSLKYRIGVVVLCFFLWPVVFGMLAGQWVRDKWYGATSDVDGTNVFFQQLVWTAITFIGILFVFSDAWSKLTSL